MSTMSDEFGVALAKELCPICCKEIDGPIIIGSKRSKTNAQRVNELNGKPISWSKKPCPECQKLIDEGVFFIIGVDGSKTENMNNPYRSGHIVGITKDCDFYKALDKQFKEADAVFMDYRNMMQCNLINEA